mmetsp:Transcript_4378/g.8626  ORF Transcript_4378/g.8626 Transcript_4378/m.8626 type:complete len:214 (+) Transcript_4378:130-771(+)
MGPHYADCIFWSELEVGLAKSELAEAVWFERAVVWSWSALVIASVSSFVGVSTLDSTSSGKEDLSASPKSYSSGCSAMQDCMVVNSSKQSKPLGSSSLSRKQRYAATNCSPHDPSFIFAIHGQFRASSIISFRVISRSPSRPTSAATLAESDTGVFPPPSCSPSLCPVPRRPCSFVVDMAQRQKLNPFTSPTSLGWEGILSPTFGGSMRMEGG